MHCIPKAKSSLIQAHNIQKMVDKLDFIKISVCSVKDNVKRMKKELSVSWGEIFQITNQ